MTKEQITKWCEDTLFGNRYVPGIDGKIPLTPTQLAMLHIAVDIIEKWEKRNAHVR